MVFPGLRRGLVGWGRLGLDILFPPRCVFCRAELGPDHGLAPDLDGAEPAAAASARLACPACRRRLVVDRTRCRRCGAPAAGEAGGDACAICRRVPPPCAGLVVLGAYADDLRDAVLRAKRPTGEPVAAGLACLLADAHRETVRSWGIDVVVPVPMHWRRRLLRGTSSADELARGFAAAVRIPCRRLIRRRRATRMQNELPVANRRGNVRDAFGPTLAGRLGLLRGRRVLLVDDVTTTGATLTACRHAAINAGAAAVYAAVVARADRSEDAAGRDAD